MSEIKILSTERTFDNQSLQLEEAAIKRKWDLKMQAARTDKKICSLSKQISKTHNAMGKWDLGGGVFALITTVVGTIVASKLPTHAKAANRITDAAQTALNAITSFLKKQEEKNLPIIQGALGQQQSKYQQEIRESADDSTKSMTKRAREAAFQAKQQTRIQ